MTPYFQEPGNWNPNVAGFNEFLALSCLVFHPNSIDSKIFQFPDKYSFCRDEFANSIEFCKILILNSDVSDIIRVVVYLKKKGKNYPLLHAFNETQNPRTATANVLLSSMVKRTRGSLKHVPMVTV